MKRLNKKRYRELLTERRSKRNRMYFKIFVSLLPLSVIRRAFEIYYNEFKFGDEFKWMIIE